MGIVKIGIAGVCGKMGRRILNLALADSQVEVKLGIERPGHPEIGSVLNGVTVAGSLPVSAEVDVLIDFTSPLAALEHLDWAVQHKASMVIGTTGFSQEQLNSISKAAETIAVVLSPNMSIGVNLLFKIIRECAQILKGYSAQVFEAHHIHKKDAPSGTAKKIVKILQEQGFPLFNEDVGVVREDEIVGEHKVVFDSGQDKIEVFHSAKNRDIFAQGAITAAKWVKGKNAGLYSMDEVLFGGGV